MTREDGADDLTVSAALRFGRDRLVRTSTETPGLDAEVLLRSVLGIDRTTLFVRLPEPMRPAALTEYRRLVAERARGVPVAYLTGEREFMGLSIAVGPGVLVPRPETEILVEWAIDWLRGRDRPATVFDIGAGAGAIALSIAARMGADWSGRIVAADVSAAAIAIAAQNRTRLGLEGRVSLVQGSLASWVGRGADLLLANLPYLRPEQFAANPGLAAEPQLALDGGDDGLALIRQLLHDAPRIVAAGGAIGVEIDPSQREAVVRMAAATFPAADIRVLRDLAGLDRHVTIQTVAC